MRTSASIHSNASIPFQRRARRTASASRLFSSERWIVFVMLLATTVFPAISKYHGADPNQPLSSPYAEVVWSLLYLLAGVRLFALRASVYPLLTKSLALGALLGYMLLSITWSVLPTTTLHNAVELVGTAMIAFYIVVRFTLRECLEILGLVFATIGFACLAMVFGAPGHGRMEYGSGAWSGIFQDKNTLAAAMALGIMTFAPLALEGSRKSRFWSVCGLLLCAVLLAGSKSATATLALGVSLTLVAIGFILRSTKLNTLLRFVIVGSCLMVAAVFWALGVTMDSFLSLLGRSDSLTGRTDFWPYLQQAIAQRPIFGYGYNAFFRSDAGANALSYYQAEAGGWTPYHAHDSFLQVSLDGGAIGLALLVWVVILALVRAVKLFVTSSSKLSMWPLAIVLYLIAGSYTETYLNQVNTFEMIFFVLALLYPLRAALGKKNAHAS